MKEHPPDGTARRPGDSLVFAPYHRKGPMTGRATEFLPLIIEHAQEAELERDEDSGFLRLSATGACVRETNLAARGCVVENIQGRRARILSAGTERHKRVLDLLCYYSEWLAEQHNLNIDVDQEVEVWLDTMTKPPSWLKSEDDAVEIRGRTVHVRGRADIVLYDTDGTPSDVLDFKTMGPFPFKKFKGGEVPQSYLWQLAAYCTAIHAKRAWILAEDSGTREWHLVEVTDRMPTERDVLRRWERILSDARPAPEMIEHWLAGLDLNEGLEGKKLPWQCSYCKVGPLIGKCLEQYQIIEKAKNGRPPEYRVGAKK